MKRPFYFSSKTELPATKHYSGAIRQVVFKNTSISLHKLWFFHCSVSLLHLYSLPLCIYTHTRLAIITTAHTYNHHNFYSYIKKWKADGVVNGQAKRLWNGTVRFQVYHLPARQMILDKLLHFSNIGFVS